MKQINKVARDKLGDSSRTEFYSIILELKLTAEEREILVLHFVEGFPYNVIADRHGMSIRTVGRIADKAYKKLNRLMEQKMT